jgi:peptidyl-prolyl cis-trans isomerase C
MINRSQNSATKALCYAIILLLVQTTAALSEEKAAPKKKGTTMEQASPSTVLAKVNGVAITRGERDRALQEILAQGGGRGGQQPTPEMMPQMENAALDQLINIEVLYQKGKKLTVKDLEQKVDEKVGQTRKQFPSQADFEKALKGANITENKLKDLARRNIVIDNLMQKEVFSKITVTEADAKKFYDDNPDKFKMPERTQASHILISADQKATPEDKKKAKEKAEAIRKRVAKGEDFATVAKAESNCPSAAKGGDLGYFGKGQMVPEFEKAAAALKLGELSDVVESPFGYHIIKVMDRKPADTVKFAEVKDKIEDYLKGQKAQKPMSDYVEKIKKEAKVEIEK